MKTPPCDQEYHGIQKQKDLITDEKISDNLRDVSRNLPDYSRHNNSNDCQNSSELDTLIICNPGLASSFQTVKSEKHRLSPGHYLHKVFLTSVAQKFRSQSLPNCFEKRKLKDKIEDINGTLSETSVPLVDTVGLDTRPSADSKECASEGWFKTWPERSIDKISNLNSDSHCEIKNSIETECVNIDKQTPLGIVGNDIDFKSERINTNVDFTLNNQSREQSCVKEFSVGTAQYSDPGKVNKKFDVNTNPRLVKSYCNGAIPNQNQSNVKPVCLDELLDSFPLAYSPLTKQLLLIKPETQQLRNSSTGSFKIDISNNESNRPNGNLNLEELESDTKTPFGVKECTATSNIKRLECDLPVQGLRRVNTDVSSFSSTVSSLSDISPSTVEDSALGSLLDHGDTCSLVSIGGCSAFSEDSVETENKKKSLSGFFSRNVFNWKSGSRSEDSFGRWKLFGKNTSPLSSHSSLTVDQYAESDRGSLAPDSPCSVRSSGSAARLETRVASSSALIQLDRPANLPAKSEEEQARHRAQYQQILDAAKKKELKEAKIKKKQLQMQLKAEEQLAQAIRTWTQEILPKWDQMHSSKKARDLWWQGVPPCVRGRVWKLAIGNPLNLTHSLYNVYVQRACDRLRGGGPSSEDDKEASMELIQLDISRTFPHLCIFQRGGPYYDMLHCLLAAYVCYRPDIGYVQGMSFIAAVLILNMEAADAFVCFANLLERPCHRAFFHLSQPHMQAYYATYDQLFRENLPQLHGHFTSTTLTPDLYLLDWIYTVFTKTMNLDLACRVWDVFLRDGEQFLFRTALGVLHLCQDVLLQMDFVRGSQFLTRLPDDLPGDQLFKSISCIRMTIGKHNFQDVLAHHSSDLDSQ